MPKFISILNSWHLSLTSSHLLVMWVTLEMFETIKVAQSAGDSRQTCLLVSQKMDLEFGIFLYVPHT